MICVEVASLLSQLGWVEGTSCDRMRGIKVSTKNFQSIIRKAGPPKEGVRAWISVCTHHRTSITAGRAAHDAQCSSPLAQSFYLSGWSRSSAKGYWSSVGRGVEALWRSGGVQDRFYMLPPDARCTRLSICCIVCTLVLTSTSPPRSQASSRTPSPLPAHMALPCAASASP